MSDYGSFEDCKAHRSCFRLSPEQWERYKAFREAAKNGGAKRYDGACGGAYEFTFIPTSIGTMIRVTDTVEQRVLELNEDFG